MKKWKDYPLLLAVVITGLLCGLIGMWTAGGRQNVRGWLKEPAFTALFQNIGNRTYEYGPKKAAQQTVAVQDTERSPETETVKDDETEQPDRTYDFTTVKQSYFDDAVFIGDSRTVGLHDYSGWDNATYYASIGMTVYDLFDKPVVEENGTEITIEQALKEHSFKKIYLMVGINEMGTGTVDSFMEAYTDAVSHLQELQPDAIIFVEGIMYVKQEKSEKDPIFNNPNIQARNERIAQLADNRTIFYIDVNEVVTDETGNLNPAYTYDEIHLLGKYYSVWTDFLLKHGIVK